MPLISYVMFIKMFCDLHSSHKYNKDESISKVLERVIQNNVCKL